jgi:uncharacterized protein (DUF362 family)
MSKQGPTVLLRACPDYDPERIRGLVREALDTLDLKPHGRTLVKPNVVAAGKFFPHAHTRPEFMEGVLRGLRDRAQGMEELAIGERCGITVPTRAAFGQAGFYTMARKVGGVRMFHFDECTQVEIPYRHDDRLRDRVFVPEPVARADFFVNCPKFKAHPWTTVTFSMKNYIGIQDDRHRLLDHDHHLEKKVADLQYVIQPQFIAVDAIIAGEGRMLTPIPFDLGLAIFGNNQVALDVVCCHLIGVNPMDVPHIRLAAERGFGPIELDKITIDGDVSLDAAKERAQGFSVGLIRVEDYFDGTAIRAYAGPPPSDSEKYCWGGCPGALEEAIEILRLFDKATDDKLPPMHVVFGNYKGPIHAKEGERIVFLGDCAQFHGDIAGKRVNVESTYVDRSNHDPLDAKHDDIYAKMFHVTHTLWQDRKQQIIRIPGCPVSVAEQVLVLVQLGGLKNPYFDPSQVLPFNNAYFSWRTRTMLKRLFGQPYNQPGPIQRGAARPRQDAELGAY